MFRWVALWLSIYENSMSHTCVRTLGVFKPYMCTTRSLYPNSTSYPLKKYVSSWNHSHIDNMFLSSYFQTLELSHLRLYVVLTYHVHIIITHVIFYSFSNTSRYFYISYKFLNILWDSFMTSYSSLLDMCFFFILMHNGV